MHKLYERAERNKILSGINAIQNSIWYPIGFAVLGALACSFDFDYIFIYFISAATIFALLFNRDIKPALVTVFLVYLILSLHGDPAVMPCSNYEVGHTFWQLFQLISNGAIMLTVFVVRLAIEGKLKNAVRRHAFTASLLAICVAFALNGLFYENYLTVNLWMALIEFAGFLPVFLLLLCALGGEKGGLRFVCKLLAVIAGMILLELGILIIKLAAGGNLFIDGGINRDNIMLGWAFNNNIAEMLMITLPALMYLAFSDKKLCLLWLVLAVVELVAVLFIMCRAALLVGGMMFAACLIIMCIKKGENRRLIRIASGVIAVVGGIALIILLATGKLQDMFWHIFDDSGPNGRFEIWGNGWENFKRNPIFGAGFGEHVYPPDAPCYDTPFFTQNMYHNIAVQFLAACGIVGVLAFIFHIYELVRFFVKQRDNGILFFGIIIVTILGISMFDTFIFLPNIALYYAAILAVVECEYQTQKAAAIEAAAKISGA